MITRRDDGAVTTKIYTVSNDREELVVATLIDLVNKTGLNTDDATAVLFGDCKVKGWHLTDITETEIKGVKGYGLS